MLVELINTLVLKYKADYVSTKGDIPAFGINYVLTHLRSEYKYEEIVEAFTLRFASQKALDAMGIKAQSQVEEGKKPLAYFYPKHVWNRKKPDMHFKRLTYLKMKQNMDALFIFEGSVANGYVVKTLEKQLAHNYNFSRVDNIVYFEDGTFKRCTEVVKAHEVPTISPKRLKHYNGPVVHISEQDVPFLKEWQACDFYNRGGIIYVGNYEELNEYDISSNSKKAEVLEGKRLVTVYKPSKNYRAEYSNLNDDKLFVEKIQQNENVFSFYGDLLPDKAALKEELDDEVKQFFNKYYNKLPEHLKDYDVFYELAKEILASDYLVTEELEITTFGDANILQRVIYKNTEGEEA